MSHFAFVAPPFLGHLNPMLALAEALTAGGHQVTFLGMADVDPAIRAGGGALVVLGRVTHPAGTLDRMAANMAAPHGFGFVRIMRDMMAMTGMLCREMPAACRDLGVSGIVTDQLEAAGALVARHLGVPYVSVANALPINREPGVPPPFVDWPYDASRRGLGRNRGGYRVADVLMGPLGRLIAREAARLGAGPARSLDDCLSPFADIAQLVPELDFPRVRRAATAHGCGPLRASAEDKLDPALLGDGSRPLVFASLGSLQGGRAGLFRRIAAACADLGLHLVIAHGGRLSGADVAALQGSPVVRSFVPQRALLPHAALAITNGGLNTVLDAAAAGVPTLVLPIAFEQGAIAARVGFAGVGIALKGRELRPAPLRDAIARLIEAQDMRARARRLADVMASYRGVAAAADIIEAVMRTGRPVARAAVAASA